MVNLKVDVVAMSSVVPSVELHRGLSKLESLGFDIHVAANMHSQHFAYAGDEVERANAFYAASNSNSDIVWAARGGYGACQMLQALEKMAIPSKQKILIGYSDVTALYQFVSHKWGWKILHASMICSTDFHQMREDDEQTLMSLLHSSFAISRWQKQSLDWIVAPQDPAEIIEGQLYGGNLAVICAMIGTPWQLDLSNKILFFEEIAESWSKVQRMLQQLYFCGSLNNCKAIVLGEFTHCRDASPQGLVTENNDSLKALRVTLSDEKAKHLVFSELGKALNIPICSGLPVGHCPQNAPLPLLATYSLSQNTGLSLLRW